MIGPDLDAILAAGPEAAAHYDQACRSFADAERRRATLTRQDVAHHPDGRYTVRTLGAVAS